MDEYVDFPQAATFIDELYIQLLKTQHERQRQHIEKLKEEKKEWQEYMTTWFHEIKTPIAVSRMIYETGGSMESLEEEMDKIEHAVEQALYFSRLGNLIILFKRLFLKK